MPSLMTSSSWCAQLDGVDLGRRCRSWLKSLTSRELAAPSLMPLARRAGLVTSRSSPTNCRRSPSLAVMAAQSSPAFLERILDGDDRVLVDEVLVEVEHVAGFTVVAFEVVLAGLLVVELGGSHVEADADLLARLVAGGGDGVHDVLEGVLVGLHLRGEAALVAEAGVQALLLQDVLQGVVDLDASVQSLAVGVEAVRGDHVLLDVGGEVSVSATVHDVHVRDRQDVAVGAADVAVQRLIADSAEAYRAARDTPRMALAPSVPLFGVPSSSSWSHRAR